MQSNLLSFLDQVTRIIDQGFSTDAIYFDFAKAFDKVPHRRLLLKLENHGIGGRLLAWIKDWLRARRQRVCLQGAESGWKSVVSGVPQGSVLGAVLFLVYINDSGPVAPTSVKIAEPGSKLKFCCTTSG
jgi:ribonuclease P/MRP protein subunit RPP40